MVKLLLTRASFLFLLPCLLLFLSSCGETTPTYQVTYQPFIPVTFSIDTNGKISIQGNLAIETPVGIFTLSAGVSGRPQPDNNTLLLIIRHKQDISLIDSYYRIQTGQEEVIIITNGTTRIDVTQHKVFIDASNGDINSITVKDANSGTASLVAEAPTPLPGPTIANAANLIIHFYDEKGPQKGSYLMKDITSLSVPTPIDSQMQSCVDAAYEFSFLYSPETVQGTNEDTFTLQFSGSSWMVVSMDGCTFSDSKTIPPLQTSSVAPPTYSQALPLIKPYFDNSPYWKTGWVLYSVQGLTFRQQFGDHVGACVSYTYAYWDNPNTPVGTDQREFGFEYSNRAWQIGSVDDSYPMGHSSC